LHHPILMLRLPDWLEKLTLSANHAFSTVEERMDFVIGLSHLNIDHKTGGPFAAAIFRSDSGTLMAPSVNLVQTGRCSVLHAEIVAIMIAQQKAATYDLSAAELPPCELVTSTEPCAMFLGAVTWSGIRKLACGARGSDAEDTGFDEGEKPLQWVEALERRGISVLRDIHREKAAAVLKKYRATGGVIYNPRRHFNF
jgi:tRNA(Arg) A34 adenosine deaminase TadA